MWRPPNSGAECILELQIGTQFLEIIRAALKVTANPEILGTRVHPVAESNHSDDLMRIISGSKFGINLRGL